MGPARTETATPGRNGSHDQDTGLDQNTGLDQEGAFGRAFLAAAITPRRVAEVVTDLLRDGVEFGPARVGPHGLATATARGEAGSVQVERLDPRTLEIVVPVDVHARARAGAARFALDLTVTATVRIRPRVLARPAPVVVAGLEPVTEDSFVVDVDTRGVSGALLRLVGNLDAEARYHARRYAEDMLETRRIRELLWFDLTEAIARVWEAGVALPAENSGDDPVGDAWPRTTNGM